MCVYIRHTQKQQKTQQCVISEIQHVPRKISDFCRFLSHPCNIQSRRKPISTTLARHPITITCCESTVCALARKEFRTHKERRWKRCWPKVTTDNRVHTTCPPPPYSTVPDPLLSPSCHTHAHLSSHAQLCPLFFFLVMCLVLLGSFQVVRERVEPNASHKSFHSTAN